MSHVYSYSNVLVNTTVQSSSTSASQEALYSILKRLPFSACHSMKCVIFLCNVSLFKSTNCIRPAFLRSKTLPVFPTNTHFQMFLFKLQHHNKFQQGMHTLLKLIWTFGYRQRFHSNQKIKWKAWLIIFLWVGSTFLSKLRIIQHGRRLGHLAKPQIVSGVISLQTSPSIIILIIIIPYYHSKSSHLHISLYNELYNSYNYSYNYTGL